MTEEEQAEEIGAALIVEDVAAVEPPHLDPLPPDRQDVITILPAIDAEADVAPPEISPRTGDVPTDVGTEDTKKSVKAVAGFSLAAIAAYLTTR